MANPRAATARQRLSPFLGLAALLASCASNAVVVPERAATVIDPGTAGAILGRAELVGTPTAREPIPGALDHGCSSSRTLRSERVIAPQGKLPNVFVRVTRGLEGMTFAVPTEAAVLEQVGCHFHPHVLGAQAYQPIRFVNRDPRAHDIRSAAATGQRFRVKLAAHGTRVQQFDHEETMPIRCELHGWMTGYLAIVDHPYFAVTGEDGTYAIRNLPPGTYTLEAWHEVYGTTTTEVRLAAKETATALFTFRKQ